MAPDGDPRRGILSVPRAAINSSIPSIPCSWLNIQNIAGDARQLNIAMSGVAGDPLEANSEIISTLQHAGVPNTNADFSAVTSIEPGGCSALNAYGKFQGLSTPRLTTKQLIWSMQLMKEGDYKGERRPTRRQA